MALTARQTAPVPDPAAAFIVRGEMIPARDGVKLFTKIFTPKNQSGPLPIVFRRTPYGIDGAASSFVRYYKALADEGYIFVFQDIRGKFKSEGEFVMQRPARTPGDTKSLDEGTDTYDTIEWLLKNVPQNNGRVGMLGVSYDGWTTIMGAIEPHPALKAISPQASPADMWLGDDFHHNGAFRLSYAFEYATMMESGKDVKNFEFDRYDTFDWYLSLGPLSAVNRKYLRETIPTWNDYVRHPDYDQFWKRQTMIPFIRSVKVPTLNVAGWWDQEDFYGPVTIYEALEKYDTSNQNYLVVGPWNHGGWTGNGTSLGPIGFGGDTAAYFRDQVQAPFFAYFLKDKGTRNFPEALTFESGANQWRKWSQWPPAKETKTVGLYFGANEVLAIGTPPAPGATGSDPFVSDPAHPVPYRQRPIQATYFPGGSKWSTWLVEDQRFVDDRADVLSWESPTAHVGHDDCRRGRRQAVRIDHRHGRRLDREAHRRVSRAQSRQLEPRGLPVDGVERGVPWPLPQGHRGTVADSPRGRAALHLQPAHAELHVQGGSPSDGAGAEHVVPDHRPEPADVHEEHLRRGSEGLREGHAPRVPLGALPVAGRGAGGDAVDFGGRALGASGPPYHLRGIFISVRRAK